MTGWQGLIFTLVFNLSSINLNAWNMLLSLFTCWIKTKKKKELPLDWKQEVVTSSRCTKPGCVRWLDLTVLTVLLPRGDILDGPLLVAADKCWKSSFLIKCGGVATLANMPGVRCISSVQSSRRIRKCGKIPGCQIQKGKKKSNYWAHIRKLIWVMIKLGHPVPGW